MSTSGDLNAVLNQLLMENRALKLLVLPLLREKNIDSLNGFISEVEARTKLAVNNERDAEAAEQIKISGEQAVSTLRTMIAEKSASL
ncbi:hypothetical protein [Pantoea sp.]|uniref:hypothetical protein n=1 Tax=Pantoea sp. TaxID=69393 RepID=UPI0029083DAF|nr:hypothetical protein [Pantoea sp.]MDU5475946.1 hypothetical protein [Pantoea sp.]